MSGRDDRHGPSCGPPSETEVTVTEELAGQTVARVLRSACPGQSWNRIRRLVAARRVAVNGVLCLDDARRTGVADVVTVFEQPLPPPPDDGAVVLRHFDESIVVVEKPPGMVSRRHVAEIDWPARRRRIQPSLDEVVLRIVARETGFRRDPAEFPPRRRRSFARSVHRLDRDTSGLIVFARTADSAAQLITAFSEHAIERVYQAVVVGTPAEGTVESRLVRDRGDGLRGSFPLTDAVHPASAQPARAALNEAGRRAVTHVKVLRRFGGYSLVECRLETGRTHQIRIHLAEAGHPVCGDSLYRGGFGSEPVPDRSGAPRLALHACRLGLTHPATGERLKFESGLPADLQRFLDTLDAVD